MNLRDEAIEQGLTSQEYDQIVGILGRDPNPVELGIFAVMWSEHCCYKSSRLHLKQLPTKGSCVLQGPGENAGIIDVGDNQVVAFKVESHNHPSFIEPYQGAATGVGGILRDIFTMGARPIAVLDSLYFGEPTFQKTPFLVHGVVGGIGGYGNCMGIPTVGGEVHFDASYNGNNLVNAMAVGIAERGAIHKAIAKGEGNRVLYLGSTTGRDGIHGATMASEEFGSGNEERRPTVQVGDPFTEKLLMEACLEMMEAGLLVGIQDMGAAGIACSTFEMSSRGGSGMKIDLDQVPLRDRSINAYEIFLSESQERMLLVATPDMVEKVQAVARKWDLTCNDIGVVTSTQRVEATYHGEKVVDLPVDPITEQAPIYDRPWETPKVKTETLKAKDWEGISPTDAILKLLASPNLSSKRYVYEQYDSTVGTDTVVRPGWGAAVLRLKGTKKGLGMTLDGNPYYVSADPYLGTQHVVAEAVRNLAVAGIKPLAVTNCLNFANPEVPEIMGTIRESIRGLSDACRFFSTPVTGGNVSLYNQTGETPIRPTPTIGMVGLAEDIEKTLNRAFVEDGHCIALIGQNRETLIYDSEFARSVLDRLDLACPPLDLSQEGKLKESLLELAGQGLIRSANDCADGGLIRTLVDSSLTDSLRPKGIRLSLPQNVDSIPFLFGEYGARAIVSYDKEMANEIERRVKAHELSFVELGTVHGDALEIDGICRIALSELRELREQLFREM